MMSKSGVVPVRDNVNESNVSIDGFGVTMRFHISNSDIGQLGLIIEAIIARLTLHGISAESLDITVIPVTCTSRRHK